MDTAFAGAVPHLRNASRGQVIDRQAIRAADKGKAVGVTDQVLERGMKQAQHDESQGGRSNLRTALILLSIALVFFIGVIVNRVLFN